MDFDSLYGHRNDRDGYARALSEFDAWLRDALPLLGEDDALLITADHGCDPGHAGTDHPREYVPLLACGKRIRAGVNLGTLPGLGCVGRTAAQLLGVDCALAGESFAPAICKEAL